jgi:hypothetical protein
MKKERMRNKKEIEEIKKRRDE